MRPLPVLTARTLMYPGISSSTAKLKQHEAKFYLVNISPSQKELDHIDNDTQKLKTYARNVMAEYVTNFTRIVGLQL